MDRCLQLAAHGLGRVSPNPMVGCVIVHGKTIIGEGYHRTFGGPHAEQVALESVTDTSLLAKSRLYVSLEPCCHYGKTPPCTDLILRHGIREVIVGMKDPYAPVNGRGIALLRKNGVTVTVPVEEARCRDLNRRFVTRVTAGRPYVILKWAQSRDGFMAPAGTPGPVWISNAFSRMLVHRWRAEEDAVLVGTGTALADNPRLNVRLAAGRNPLRIVMDRSHRLPASLHLFDGKIPTLVLTASARSGGKHLDYAETDFSRFPEHALSVLGERNIQSVIVEGGAHILRSFLDAGLWDEVRRFTGDAMLLAGLPAPPVAGTLRGMERLGNDLLEVFTR